MVKRVPLLGKDFKHQSPAAAEGGWEDSKDVFVLGSIEDITVALEDSLVTISTIAGGPGSFFLRLANVWVVFFWGGWSRVICCMNCLFSWLSRVCFKVFCFCSVRFCIFSLAWRPTFWAILVAANPRFLAWRRLVAWYIFLDTLMNLLGFCLLQVASQTTRTCLLFEAS